MKYEVQVKGQVPQGQPSERVFASEDEAYSLIQRLEQAAARQGLRLRAIVQPLPESEDIQDMSSWADGAEMERQRLAGEGPSYRPFKPVG